MTGKAADKKTRGRQPVEIKLIVDEKRRRQTASKRKRGLQKKVTEYATMTGSDVLLMILTPTGKMYIHGTDQPVEVARQRKVKSKFMSILRQKKEEYDREHLKRRDLESESEAESSENEGDDKESSSSDERGDSTSSEKDSDASDSE